MHWIDVVRRLSRAPFWQVQNNKLLLFDFTLRTIYLILTPSIAAVTARTTPPSTSTGGPLDARPRPAARWMQPRCHSPESTPPSESAANKNPATRHWSWSTLGSCSGRTTSGSWWVVSVRFPPSDGDKYRVVQRYLTALEREEGVSWFDYSLPADRSLKVAIRNLKIRKLREVGFALWLIRI